MKTILLVIMIAAFHFSALTAQADWQNVCPDPEVLYCKNVGKSACNATGTKFMRNVRLGQIIGVSWRPKGSVIGISGAIPAAGIPQSVRTSPRNAYYYIIDDGSGKPFLRQCREIDAK